MGRHRNSTKTQIGASFCNKISWEKNTRETLAGSAKRNRRKRNYASEGTTKTKTTQTCQNCGICTCSLVHSANPVRQDYESVVISWTILPENDGIDLLTTVLSLTSSCKLMNFPGTLFAPKEKVHLLASIVGSNNVIEISRFWTHKKCCWISK